MRAKRRHRRLARAARENYSAGESLATTITRLTALAVIALVGVSSSGRASEGSVRDLLERHCVECHNTETSEGSLNLNQTAWELHDSHVRQRWVQIHDRIQKGEMPPDADDLPEKERAAFVRVLGAALHEADLEEVQRSGRAAAAKSRYPGHAAGRSRSTAF